MIDRSALTKALTAEVKRLVEDLRHRASTVPDIREQVNAEWAAAVEAGRTAHDAETWQEGLLAQVAVSWVLGCVFVRFCEDNRLVGEPMLSGVGEWRRWSEDAQVDFFRKHPESGERDYLKHVFSTAALINGLADVFDAHNPVWRFGPSDDACRSLLGVWRSADPATGELTWDFTDPSWDTRFLGDLYQDLSEHAKKTYALLQTPEFVESFILDRTLDPALEEFGLDGHDGTGFRLIDPACGSGHFLLGAFRRLAQRHLDKNPAPGGRAAAALALESVFGVDLNPFAAAVGRFRLLIAALKFSEIDTLAEAPAFHINIAVGDSLLHGPAPGRLQGVLETDERQHDTSRHLYATEDAETVGMLTQRYHAVVANPPYITPKDPAANTLYRGRYETCSGKYSLSVPFMEQLFELALRGNSGRPAGYVGQITANSFTKRQFGRKLIQEYLSRAIDLTHVIDTSGTYLPGHGTPTVILFGRNQAPVGDSLRAVLGIRGEPKPPEDASKGHVWASITQLVDTPDSENEYISVANIRRSTVAKHPWSLQGGAAAPLKKRIEDSTQSRLDAEIGVVAVPGTDEALFLAPNVGDRHNLQHVVSLVVGDAVRDYGLKQSIPSLFPYSDGRDIIPFDDLPRPERTWLWPRRATLGSYRWFGKDKWENGTPWHSWGFVAFDKLARPMSISFAAVTTHNHFVLDRGGKVFKQSAPVIKLDETATEVDHLQLLGLLNCSVACFWMKQVFYPKGGDPMGSDGARLSVAPWSDRYDFDATKLKQFPVAKASVLPLAQALDDAAAQLSGASPEALAERCALTAANLDTSEREVGDLRSQMVWLQDELDWRCMHLYGATDDDLSFGPDRCFPLAKGERSFEIALARRMATGETTSTWFERHDTAAITNLPAHWPDWYRHRVEQRLELIESDRFVNLLERPEYKRRWQWTSWDDLAQGALTTWLQTRLENDRYWPKTEPRSVAQLADEARGDEAFMLVAELYTKSPEIDLVALIDELATPDSVPYLATWRYNEPGLRTRAAWERTWELQRREDAGEDVGKIPVPPMYKSSDFRSTPSWKLRGKLDVPKERFVSYPSAERATDGTTVLGWAGWDHLQRAQALTALYLHRSQTEGWETPQLIPLLAGLAELVPWLRQWHNDLDPAAGQGLGDYYADYLSSQLQQRGLSNDDLIAWRPPEKSKRRRKKATP